MYNCMVVNTSISTTSLSRLPLSQECPAISSSKQKSVCDAERFFRLP